MGKGIIDPVDDIRASNPPSNPALLDALTKDFVEHGFDLRHLMRTIANSRTYQAAIVTNEWNEDDRDNFSHAIPRRLAAEELMDAVTSATGVRPRFPDVPDDMAALSSSTRTSAKKVFWICSDAPRASLPANASGELTSACRRH